MAQVMDMGVDGIVTDRPDLLREVMARRGLPLPKPTPVRVD
jgi:glycerophosphoryl diester phosphodiesterase